MLNQVPPQLFRRLIRVAFHQYGKRVRIADAVPAFEQIVRPRQPENFYGVR